MTIYNVWLNQADSKIWKVKSFLLTHDWPSLFWLDYGLRIQEQNLFKEPEKQQKNNDRYFEIYCIKPFFRWILLIHFQLQGIIPVNRNLKTLFWQIATFLIISIFWDSGNNLIFGRPWKKQCTNLNLVLYTELSLLFGMLFL